MTREELDEVKYIIITEYAGNLYEIVTGHMEGTSLSGSEKIEYFMDYLTSAKDGSRRVDNCSTIGELLDAVLSLQNVTALEDPISAFDYIRAKFKEVTGRDII